MWKLSPKASELVRQLYQLEQSSRGSKAGPQRQTLCSILSELAETSEPSAIPSLVTLLSHADPVVRSSARHTVSILLDLVPPYELLSFSDLFTWFYDWVGSEDWQNIQPQDVARLAEEEDGTSNPAVLGILSFHRNGYVRHAAVHELAKIPNGSELPFLIIRQNDWAGPIAADAQAAVASRLTNDYLPYLAKSLRLILHLQLLSRYDHSHVARQTVHLLMQPQYDDELQAAVNSANRDVRRAVVKLGLENAGKPRERLVRHALASADPIVRLSCCRYLAQTYLGNDLVSVLDRLQHDSSMPVRREALSILAEQCPSRAEETWARALLDRSAPIRELARFHLARIGIRDFAARYRNAVSKAPDSLTAIEGLAETAEAIDAVFFRELLKHRYPSRRRAAIRGLVRANGVSFAVDVLSCLEDESPAVVQEAWQALKPHVHSIQPDVLFSVAQTAVHSLGRRAAVTMISDLGKWRSLPWLIRLVAEEEADVSHIAGEMIGQWYSSPKGNRFFLRPSQEETQAIGVALVAAGSRLPVKLRGLIKDELGESAPASNEETEAKYEKQELPDFKTALEQWQTFLRREGFTGDPLWVFREDVVELGRHIYVKTPLKNSTALVERVYNAGARRGLGVSLEVYCVFEGQPCCYIWVPQDETDASYRMLCGLKMSTPVGSSLKPATSVSSGLLWRWLKWRGKQPRRCLLGKGYSVTYGLFEERRHIFRLAPS